MVKPLIQMVLDSLTFESVKQEQVDRKQTMFVIQDTHKDIPNIQLIDSNKPAYRNIGYKARKNKY